MLSLQGANQLAAADTKPPSSATPATVSSDPLPTAQIDGVVWTQLIVGDVVYVGGQFTTARPAGAAAGAQTATRSNFLAYDLKTGALIDSFKPSFNGTVRALAVSTDQTTLYVGGQFTAVDGANRYRLAAFDLATGAPKKGFSAGTNSSVYGLAVTASRLYAVGPFTSMNNVARTGAASLDLATGAVTPFVVTPSAASLVRSVIVSPDATKVVLGGNFTTMNGSSNPGYGLAMVNADSGALLPMPVNALLRDAGTKASIMSLAGTATGFYGSGYSLSRALGNLEGSFRADWNGNLVWVEDCHGDTYSVAPVGDELYVAGHPHYCSGVGGFPQTDPWGFHRGLAFTQKATGVLGTDSRNYFNYAGQPAPSPLNWYPDINAGTFTGQAQGPWHVTGNDDYVVYGGEFTAVNGKAQQGLVRFARTSIAPNADGPREGGSGQALVTRAFAGNAVRVSWKGNWDRDNVRLTYKLQRDGATIFETTADSTFWNRPNLSFIDRGVTPGSTYQYRVKVSDPYGNANWSDIVPGAAGTGNTLTRYTSMVLGDGPTAYWPFDETSSSATVKDWSGTDTAVKGSAVATGASGAISGDSRPAFRLSGASTSQVGDPVAYYSPDTMSLEGWFKTSSHSGGQIIGFDKSAAGGNTVSDRHIYLSNDGRISFAAKPNGVVKAISSTSSYNNDAWHQVVGTLGGDGMRLYVDGKQVAYSADTKAGYATTGYWRIGGAVLTGLPLAPSSRYFTGDLDEMAVYPVPLSAEQVQDHYNLGALGTAPNVAPQASFVSTVTGLGVAVDAAASADSDGTIASYAWDFGDGHTGTGVQAQHTYATAGAYDVKLTVTDDKGKVSAALTRPVTVAATPNQKPTAKLTLTQADLGISVDGKDSADSDGEIASYGWDFGDGHTGSGATTTHTYDTAGSYVVTLEVTDDDGATGTATKTISAPAGAEPIVDDDFNRTQASGLGSTQTGGAWTTSSASGFAVNGDDGLWKLNTAGTTRSAYLGEVSAESTDLRMSYTADQAGSGGGIYLTVIGRRINATSDYRLNLRHTNANKLTVSLGSTQSGVGATLSSAVTLPEPVSAGSKVNVAMQTFGTSPTTVRAKVWLDGASEPNSWTVTATDSAEALQTAGAVGFTAFVSSSATAVPIVVAVPKIVVTPVVP